MTKKIASFFCVLLAATLILSACGTSGTSSAGSASQGSSSAASNVGAVSGMQRDKDLFRWALTTDPISLDVGLYDNCYWKAAACQYFETLLRIGAEDPSELNPQLATSYKFADDFKSVTFEIRQGVKFHDGTTMTPEDVAFSIMRNKGQPANSAMGSMINSCDFTETTVTVNLDYPFLPILNVLAYATWSIYPKAYIEKCEKENINFGVYPIGTGPWKVASFRSNESISFERFEDYWGTKPAIKNLRIDIVPDQEAALVACEAGDYEALELVPGTAIERLDADPKWNWNNTPGTSWFYLGTNMTRDPFMSNQKLRQAVAHAIDRDDIASIMVDWMPIVVPLPPSVFGYMEDFPATPHDPEKAKELLTEAGYPDGISGLSFYCTTNSTFADPAIVCQAQMKEVGINADLQILERGVYLEQCTDRLDYDLIFWAFGCAYPDADAVVYSRFYSGSIGGNVNVCGVQDPALDELILKARTSTDQDERLEIYREIFTINRDNAWYIPVKGSTDAILVTNDISGVTKSWNALYYLDGYYYL